MEHFTVSSLAKAIRERNISPREAFDFCLDRIKKYNPELNAFLALNEKGPEDSWTPEGLLAGVPLGIKDLFCTEGLKSTAGSRMLETFVPPYSATVVSRLQKEGAWILGKCNTDEFAMGSTGENSYFGAVKNPWNKKWVAGGSSSGSASAVAAGLCPGALGTDTGGSIRLPASYCNLVGLKPTYGRVSRYGIVAYASSLDQAGPLSHTVEDSALLLDAISGFDSLDSTTANLPPSHCHKHLSSDVKGKKIAFFNLEHCKTDLHPEIQEAQEKTLSVLKNRGVQLIEKRWPFFQEGVSVYYLIASSEASSNLSRYDGIRYGFRSEKKAENLSEFYTFNRGGGFGLEVKRRILMGTFCLSAGYYEEYFQKACQVRHLIQKEFEEIFKNFEAILCPVTASLVPLLGKKEDLLKTYLSDEFNVFANLTGCPALSIPVSFSKEGSPLGMQLMGAPFQEQTILDLALALEEELQVQKERPHGF